MTPIHRTGWAWATLAAAVLMGSAAYAHHTGSMYDRTKPVTVKGVVKELVWVNPHSSLQVLADPGQPHAGKTWVLEMTSPGNLTRQGWTKRSLKPGDRVEVQIGPLKAGGAAGSLMQARNLATGELVGEQEP